MRTIINVFALLVFSLGLPVAILSQNQPEQPEITGIATLFARDPIFQSLCFRDGKAGGLFQQGQARNRCSDLNFNSYSINSFRVGVEGSKEGVIVDLGTPADLKTKYGYDETVGHGQGFASISVRNGKAMILKNYRTGELQEILQSASLFQKSNSNNEAAPVKSGNNYLMRITDRSDATYELLAKVLVLAFVPNESVTIRWYLMSDTKTAKL